MISGYLWVNWSVMRRELGVGRGVPLVAGAGNGGRVLDNADLSESKSMENCIPRHVQQKAP